MKKTELKACPLELSAAPTVPKQRYVRYLQEVRQ